MILAKKTFTNHQINQYLATMQLLYFCQRSINTLPTHTHAVILHDITVYV